jgi:hypothetical protein
MSIFICWSRDRSRDLALATETLVRKTLRLEKEEDVFVSDHIEKGVDWFDSIVTNLQRAAAGIVCLTAENLEGAWLHFEAGALAMRLAKQPPDGGEQGEPRPAGPSTPRHRLFTLLHGVTGAALKGPLGAYQATSTTRPDMAAMMQSLARVLGRPHIEAISNRKAVFAEHDWNTFAASLERINVPARTLIPELESLFQRKTFNEPLYRCSDQAWLSRYDGARLTHDSLVAQVEKVRAACSAHESGLFEMLVAELDGYAMAIHSLLLPPRAFPLGDRGELVMEPGIKTCCEDRRLAIRSLAGRLLRPLDEPLREEAVRFMGAETNEERKMIVHRLEAAIRREREVAFEGLKDDTDGCITRKVINSLVGERQTKEDRLPIKFRESSWDLDRIYYYLLIQYFGAAVLRWQPLHSAADAGAETNGKAEPLHHDWLCAARDVEMEVERYRARSKGGSLMPLTYALCALQEIDRREAPNPAEARSAVKSALDLVEWDLGEESLASEAGRVIDRVVKQMRADMGLAPGPQPVAGGEARPVSTAPAVGRS